MYKTVLLVVCLLSLSFMILPKASAERYLVTPLVVPNGWINSTHINNTGQICGTIYTGDIHHACLWDSNGLLDIGTLGGVSSYGWAVNDLGQVVGCSEAIIGDPYNLQPFLWSDGKMAMLPTPGGTFSEAYDINNRGQIVGYYSSRRNPPRACIWKDGIVTDIHTLGQKSQAMCINNNGEVAGNYVFDYPPARAFIWKNGTAADLGSLEPQLVNVNVEDINDNCQVVGVCFSDNFEEYRMYSFLWQDGVMTDLGNLGYQYCCAASINNKGQIVGTSVYRLDDWEHGFIWENGVMQDLCDLVYPKHSWTVHYAYHINDKGQIVGIGWNDRVYYSGLLLTPIPDPVTVKIDVKPGDAINSINPKSKGMVPVAILSTSEFNSASVDPSSIQLKDAKPVKWVNQDVNSDGYSDMLFHFRTQDIKLSPECTEVVLSGTTRDDRLIEGIDSVKIVK